MRPLLAVLFATACAARTAPPKPVVVADLSDTPPAGDVVVRTVREPMPTPLDGVGPDLADAFGAGNLPYYAGAVGATAVIAWTGADYEIHERLSRTNERRPWSKTASIAGYVVPTVVPAALWLGGMAAHDREITGAGAATVQAVIVSMSTTALLKLATGRPRPAVDESIDDRDAPRTFEPFQRISAWPSGHATGATTVAATLTAYYPEKPWIPLLGYPVALAIGLGMIDLDGHWTSDVVAGTLIGQAVGWSIGRNFRKRVRGERVSRHAFQLAPLPPLASGGTSGMALSGRW
jgi:membrane-associated phospholipid phosphatase